MDSEAFKILCRAYLPDCYICDIPNLGYSQIYVYNKEAVDGDYLDYDNMSIYLEKYGDYLYVAHHSKLFKKNYHEMYTKRELVSYLKKMNRLYYANGK